MHALISSVFLALAACHLPGTLIAQEATTADKTQLGQFDPSTEAERELEKLLRGKDEGIDLALANWLIVADIPQFRDLTRESYLKQLDEMTEQVRQGMAKMEKVARSRGQNPNDSDTRCAIFCNAIIKLGFTYADEFRHENLTPVQMRALYRDANNVFLAGLLRTRRGSCVSMPLIYLVVGQKLGMPVYLVTVGKHGFIRWEEPGYRMNIETTSVDRVRVTPDDSVYADAEGLKLSETVGNQLRNLTRREVVGNLFFAREGHWASYGGQQEIQRCIDIARALHLAPDDPGIKMKKEALFSAYGIKPEHTSIELKIKSKG
jgi:regulator of sirC expression with transglutaminase-like and TPR domain